MRPGVRGVSLLESGGDESLRLASVGLPVAPVDELLLVPGVMVVPPLVLLPVLGLVPLLVFPLAPLVAGRCVCVGEPERMGASGAASEGITLVGAPITP